MAKKVITDTEINEFVKGNAHKADNWKHLRDMLFKELRVRLSANTIKNRGNRLEVKTKGISTPVQYETGFGKVGPVATSVLAFLKKKRVIHTLEDVADALGISPKMAKEAVEELKNADFTVNLAQGKLELSNQIDKSDPVPIPKKLLTGNTFKFLLVADNHIANKHQRLDVLNALFDIADGEGITTCYQLGNMIDGDHSFNKHEVLCRGLDAQSTYLSEVWPKKKGIVTHFITGDDHEGWYINREGINVGSYIQTKFEQVGRKDFQFIGHVEADVLLPGKKRQQVMRLIHAGGGSAYATSYSTQKIVESYQGGEKPRILCVGHYHKANFDYAREVYTYQGGCTCDQTTFMRKKKLAAHVGGWIIELTISDDGDVIRSKGDWIPFYDKGVYKTAWKAKGY